MKLIYASPVARLLGSPDDGADVLIWAINGEPGTTWQSGEYYDKRSLPRKHNPQQDDAALISAFWDESARRVGLDATTAL
jgi:hypothetical protein